ncbi:hypothetical protein HDU86_006235 [Geranomyces michiganensis]|nr:hypothetical protein HDU86_006235 [Geranomyces michiganensis]
MSNPRIYDEETANVFDTSVKGEESRDADARDQDKEPFRDWNDEQTNSVNGNEDEIREPAESSVGAESEEDEAEEPREAEEEESGSEADLGDEDAAENTMEPDTGHEQEADSMTDVENKTSQAAENRSPEADSSLNGEEENSNDSTVDADNAPFADTGDRVPDDEVEPNEQQANADESLADAVAAEDPSTNEAETLGEVQGDTQIRDAEAADIRFDSGLPAHNNSHGETSIAPSLDEESFAESRQHTEAAEETRHKSTDETSAEESPSLESIDPPMAVESSNSNLAESDTEDVPIENPPSDAPSVTASARSSRADLSDHKNSTNLGRSAESLISSDDVNISNPSNDAESLDRGASAPNLQDETEQNLTSAKPLDNPKQSEPDKASEPSAVSAAQDKVKENISDEFGSTSVSDITKVPLGKLSETPDTPAGDSGNKNSPSRSSSRPVLSSPTRSARPSASDIRAASRRELAQPSRSSSKAILASSSNAASQTDLTSTSNSRRASRVELVRSRGPSSATAVAPRTKSSQKLLSSAQRSSTDALTSDSMRSSRSQTNLTDNVSERRTPTRQLQDAQSRDHLLGADDTEGPIPGTDGDERDRTASSARPSRGNGHNAADLELIRFLESRLETLNTQKDEIQARLSDAENECLLHASAIEKLTTTNAELSCLLAVESSEKAALAREVHDLTEALGFVRVRLEEAEIRLVSCTCLACGIRSKEMFCGR